MDRFQAAEQIGRDKFLQLLQQIGATDIEFTKDQFDKTDCYFTYKDYKITAEIKVRNMNYDQYNTHLMEVKKYKALKEIVKDQQLAGFWYVNFFNNGVCCIYSQSKINKHTIRVVYKHCNRTTAIDTGKVDKRVLEIDRNVALTILFNGNKYVKRAVCQNSNFSKEQFQIERTP